MNEILRVTDLRQFPRLLNLIHDEYFDVADIAFDQSAGVLTIPYRRVFHGGPEKFLRRRFLTSIYELDVIRSELTLRHVESFTVDDHARTGEGFFNTVTFRDGVLVFTCGGLNLTAKVKAVEIESRDIEVRGKARIGRGLFWESSDSRVYD